MTKPSETFNIEHQTQSEPLTTAQTAAYLAIPPSASMETVLTTLATDPRTKRQKQPKKTDKSFDCESCGERHGNGKCPMNRKRAKEAYKTLEFFALRAGGEFYLRGKSKRMDAELIEQNMSDMLCNLAHLCDARGIQFGDVLRRAEGHYKSEVAGESAHGNEAPGNIRQQFEPIY